MRVRYWHDHADGNVELEDSEGRSLMVLAPCDHMGYENLNPQTLILHITPEQKSG